MGAQLAALGVLEIPKLKKNRKATSAWGWTRERLHAAILKMKTLPLGLQGDAEVKELLEVSGPMPESAVSDLIEVFKRNNGANGGVDAVDLLGAMIILGNMHRTTKVTYLFSLHNRNGDGDLSYPEFVVFMLSTLRSLSSIFVGYKQPSSKELEKLTSQVFNIVDTTGVENRRIQLHELLCVCYQCDELCEIMKEWDGQDPTIIDTPLDFTEPLTPSMSTTLSRGSTSQLTPGRHKIGNIPRKDVWKAYDMFCAIDQSGDKAISREEFLEMMSDPQFLSKYSVILKRVDFMAVLKSRPASLPLMEFLCLLYPRLKPDDMKVLMRWCYERDAIDIFKGKKGGRETTRQDWQDVFSALDTDKSGKISVKELKDASILSDAELYRYLAMHDEDQDGEISLEEFMTVMQKKIEIAEEEENPLMYVSADLQSIWKSRPLAAQKKPAMPQRLDSMSVSEMGEVANIIEDATDLSVDAIPPAPDSPSLHKSSPFGTSPLTFGKAKSSNVFGRSKTTESHSTRSRPKIGASATQPLASTSPRRTSQSPRTPSAAKTAPTPNRTSMLPTTLRVQHELPADTGHKETVTEEHHKEDSPRSNPTTPACKCKPRPLDIKGITSPRWIVVERWDPENPKNFPIPPRSKVEITKKRAPLFRG